MCSVPHVFKVKNIDSIVQSIESIVHSIFPCHMQNSTLLKMAGERYTAFKRQSPIDSCDLRRN